MVHLNVNQQVQSVPMLRQYMLSTLANSTAIVDRFPICFDFKAKIVPNDTLCTTLVC